MNENELKIAVIGGGTGSISILQGLRAHSKQITAVVGMADDGGSTGVLRDELGVLPAGDVWKCMAALGSDREVSELFKYRFGEGTFKGHTLGNIIMAAAEKSHGEGFTKAVRIASRMMQLEGAIAPVTLDNIRMQMTWPSGKELIGEHIIDVEQFSEDPRQATLSVVPSTAAANPAAVQALLDADVIVIAPGDIYTSLGPQLVMPEIKVALQQSSAVKVYIANLVTKPGHTTGFSVTDHADEIERLGGGEFLDYVLYNRQQPSDEALQEYAQQGVVVVESNPEQVAQKHYAVVGGDFLGKTVAQDSAEAFSVAARSMVRHDPQAVADAIIAAYEQSPR